MLIPTLQRLDEPVRKYIGLSAPGDEDQQAIGPTAFVCMPRLLGACRVARRCRQPRSQSNSVGLTRRIASALTSR
jgi:hypothetical protein